MPLHVYTTGAANGSSSSSTPIASPSSLMTPSHRGLATSAAAPGEAVLLKDEYGNMDASGQTYVVPHFTTENGYVCALEEKEGGEEEGALGEEGNEVRGMKKKAGTIWERRRGQ